ncbi:ABC transporter permease subunit [Roseomonas sp. E05]|uniref:ABC transporter permease n=1 Tax=Roseomonas sp. E05 TaxID=3046310 RepID=UPI0024B92087|nr:ABC transporter permease subunit [Roseomonas sp. E05]MDJ0387187.1 ABC transporter permease subunit [Roseomonas sp. E05]
MSVSNPPAAPSRATSKPLRLRGAALRQRWRLPVFPTLALVWLSLVGLAPALRLLAEAVGPALPRLFEDAGVWRAAGRSLLVAGGAAVLATLLGTAQAGLLLLRDLPWRRGLIFLCILPLLVPAQILALAFIQMGGPSSPLLLALGLAPPLGTTNPFYGAGGMMLLLGIQGAPLVLLAIAALVRRVPGELLPAARGMGASPGVALRRVVWPLLLPGVLAGAGLAFVAALGNFGIAALLGIPGRYTLLTVLIWQRLSATGPAALSQVAVLSLLLALLALPGLLTQFVAARRSGWAAGRPFEPIAASPLARAALVPLGLYLALVLALPLAALTVSALVPAMGVPVSPATITLRHFAATLAPGAHTFAALGNSLLLSGVAALLLALAALPVALALRHRPVRWATMGADLPYALPGACTAVSVILLVLGLPGGGAVYGTLGLILFAYLARFQALALRPVAAAAARLDPALEHAARGMGAGPMLRLVVIHLPPLAPALAAGAILVMLLAVNEVTVSSLLRGPGTVTLGVLVFNLQDGGQSPQAAAVSCLSLLLVAGLMAAATLLGRRLPAGTLPWRP